MKDYLAEKQKRKEFKEYFNQLYEGKKLQPNKGKKIKINT